MNPIAYVDTSAFLKRFLLEDRAEDMEAFVAAGEFDLAISSLTVTEFRCTLKRRLRLGQVSAISVQKAIQQLLQEIASGAVHFHSIDTATFNLAGELIEGLLSPLATLDAIHLACAKASGAALMVCADRQLLRAAAEANLETLDLSPLRNSH
jgi:uncharacterized protein